VILPQHLPPALRETAAAAPGVEERLAAALADWLDLQLARKSDYDAMHDALEAEALRHLLARFDGKPTILARETDMNRMTLRKKLAAAGIRSAEADGT
jgi:DNA-binding NtrC family response regulator